MRYDCYSLIALYTSTRSHMCKSTILCEHNQETNYILCAEKLFVELQNFWKSHLFKLYLVHYAQYGGKKTLYLPL